MSEHLHGCVGNGCFKVWGPLNQDIVCDVCGTARYDSNGEARESVVHFPLRHKLASCLRCPQYVKQVRWECDRTKSNPEYVTGNMTFVLSFPD